MTNRREALRWGVGAAMMGWLGPRVNGAEPESIAPAWSFESTSAPEPLPCAGRDGWIRLGCGRRLGYAEFGQRGGPLVFYFHGTPGARTEMEIIAGEAASAGVWGVAVDRPGFGLSDYEPGYRILDWPADVAALAAALGYGESVFGVIGLSGGAPYALSCAACMPERLTHAAVVSGHAPMNAPGTTPGSQDFFIQFLRRRPRLGSLAVQAAIGKLRRRPDAFLVKVLGRLADSDRQLISTSPTNRRIMLRTLHEASRRGPQPIMHAVNLLGSDWGFRLDRLAPTSISIWQGGCDPITPPSMGHYFHRQIAGSELYVDPRAGHLTMAKWHAAEIMARFV